MNLEKIRFLFYNNIYLILTILLVFVNLVFGLFNIISLKNGFIIDVSIILLLVVTISISNYFGLKKHKKILNFKVFQKLRDQLKFSLEEYPNKNYTGLKRIYKTYFLRVYYDWSIHIPNSKASKGICILLHFQPFFSDSKDKFDVKKITFLNKKYKRNNLLSYDKYIIEFHISHIEIRKKYNFLTTYKDVKDKIALLTTIAIKENLLPITEIEVHKLEKENPYLFGPNIKTFWGT